MLNPFQAPNPEAVHHEFREQREAARQAVNGPAIGLIAVSSLSLFMALVTIAWDTILFASDRASFDDLPMGQTGFVIKTVWGLVLAASNGFSLWGSIQML